MSLSISAPVTSGGRPSPSVTGRGALSRASRRPTLCWRPQPARSPHGLSLCLQNQCCGAYGPEDWDLNVYFNCSGASYSREKCGVPFSCCVPDPAVRGRVLGAPLQVDECQARPPCTVKFRDFPARPSGSRFWVKQEKTSIVLPEGSDLGAWARCSECIQPGPPSPSPSTENAQFLDKAHRRRGYVPRGGRAFCSVVPYSPALIPSPQPSPWVSETWEGAGSVCRG